MAIKNFFKELFNKNKAKNESCEEIRKEIEANVIEVDQSAYDSTSIVSTLEYAVSKYGRSICSNPSMLKNVLADLSPNLTREIKIVYCLCSSNLLIRLLDSIGWQDADLMLWLDSATSYLVNEEFIDKIVAFDFCRKLLIDISGKEVPDTMNVEYLKKEPEKQQREIEEIRLRLEEEKKAREIAEKKLEEEKKESVSKADRLVALEKLQLTNSVINYKEISSIQELFKKYNGLIYGNVIVVDIDWTGDYCFVVDELVRKNGIKARGTLYKDGEFYRNYTYPADNTRYRMYNGPSADEINSIHQKRTKDLSAKVLEEATVVKKPYSDNKLVMPKGSGEYTSIEKIVAANPGKRVLVVKEGWNNDYCFAIEEFEGTIKAVGRAFLNGVARNVTWYDRRHRKFKIYNGSSKKKIEAYYSKK